MREQPIPYTLSIGLDPGLTHHFIKRPRFGNSSAFLPILHMKISSPHAVVAPNFFRLAACFPTAGDFHIDFMKM